MIDRRRFGILAGAMAAGATTLQAQTPQLLMRSLKYEELGRLVRAQTGKVVLVDMWRHD